MKEHPKKKLPSTKELKGKRVNGVLYLDKGIGSGQFWNVHADGAIGGVDQYTPNVTNTKKRDDYD